MFQKKTGILNGGNKGFQQGIENVGAVISGARDWFMPEKGG